MEKYTERKRDSGGGGEKDIEIDRQRKLELWREI